MRKLKYFLRNGLQVAPFVLSTTIPFSPYVLFFWMKQSPIYETNYSIYIIYYVSNGWHFFIKKGSACFNQF